MTMENDLVERLRRAVWRLSGSGMSQVQFWKAYGDKLDGITKTEVERHEKSRIRALEAELAAALIEVSNQAQSRGEAEGKLHVSELAGIVEGWQLRAERAEAELARKTEALRPFAEYEVGSIAVIGNEAKPPIYYKVNVDGCQPKFEHFRAARSALEEKTDV